MTGFETWLPPHMAKRVGIFARRAQWVAALAILVPLVGFAGHYTYQVIRSDTDLDVLATEAQLVESFYRVVHTSDDNSLASRFGAGKWRSPVRIFYHRSLPKWHAALSRRQFAVLSRLTGLEFQEADTFDENRGISVFFTPPLTSNQRMVREFGLSPANIDRVGQATCFASYRDGPDKHIQWGYVVFTRPPEERRTEACIVEETVQVLGLQADRATYSPSVFTNARARPVALSINDKILARALYDPAITADMSNEQTEKLIPELIHRLVVGVKARGEEALYQR